ncbi:ATP-binding protein [Paenibacillus sp. GCM10012306]|uniref:ATP-binding protein n=1 Tax=Paenibacillus sp. GCM10012306 TaxID=3317342 RepID=UPI003624238F
MKLSLQKTAAVVLVLLLITAIVPIGIALEWGSPSGKALPSWELKWENTTAPDAMKAAASRGDEWIEVIEQTPRPTAPEGIHAAWLRVTVPQLTENSALLIDKVFGEEIKAFLDNKLVYELQGKNNFSGNKILIPLSGETSGGQLYLWSSGGGSKGLGIEGHILVGNYGKLLDYYVKQDFMDIVVGTALIFIASVLIVCALFLKKEPFSSAFLLVLIILSCGILVVVYSPLLPTVLGSQSRLTELLFDLALFTLLPTFTLYFERIFEGNQNRFIVPFRKFQIGYSLFSLSLWILNAATSFRLDGIYRFMTVSVVGILMIVQFVFLLTLAVIYAYRGNSDAIIFTTGFAVFALLSLTELLIFFATNERYHFYWWKWGLVVFIISLIVILGRGFARNHEQAVEYSRELEKFNNDLQRSEKMEIISELAASVAHEVRNPLQVTRGFLQILGERSGKKEKEYLQMAVAELDRASLIITDFLTFAKPSMETVVQLDVSAELRHVSGILLPLAHMQGGEIELKLEPCLPVLGSSSKFKQAFINIIKNSIEALRENGMIVITAWRSGNQILISVKDNGEGMKVNELTRLGEPYYSNKTKGTGLGLMVTFRIVEAMQGTLEFKSKKGEGTEVIIKFPAAGPE